MTPMQCQSLLQTPSLIHLPVFVCLTGTGDPGSRSWSAQYGHFHGIRWAFASSPKTATTTTDPSDRSSPSACSTTSLSSGWPEQPGIRPADTLSGSRGRPERRLHHLLRPPVSLHRLLQQQPERRATAGWDSNGRRALALRRGPASVRRVARRLQGEQSEEQFQLGGNGRTLTARHVTLLTSRFHWIAKTTVLRQCWVRRIKKKGDWLIYWHWSTVEPVVYERLSSQQRTSTGFWRVYFWNLNGIVATDQFKGVREGFIRALSDAG